METPANPQYNVQVDNHRVRIRSLILMTLVVDAIPYMSALHKAQLMGVRSSFRDQDYLTKTDFQTVVAVFRRYKDELETRLFDFDKGAGTNKLSALTIGLMEATEHETYLSALTESMKGRSDESNLEIRSFMPAENTPAS